MYMIINPTSLDKTWKYVTFYLKHFKFAKDHILFYPFSLIHRMLALLLLWLRYIYIYYILFHLSIRMCSFNMKHFNVFSHEFYFFSFSGV